MTARQQHQDAGITVRRMDFEFSNVPRYWADKDPHFTHLLNALSATFPEGERFFVHSVRHFQDRITDPVLKQQVSAFIGQEAMHAKEHSLYNEYARKHGIDLDFIENFVRKRIAFIKGKMSPERQLAITCALEHFTAILAEQMLTEPDIYENFDPSMIKLWLWHAVEESEHKGVAFDVYQDMVGDYRLRVHAMAITTFFFIMHTAWFQARLLKADGKLLDVRMWLKGLDRMWGRKGHFRKLIPSYLQYYLPDFHPWQHDSRAVLEKWKQELKLDDKAAEKKTEATAAIAEPVPVPATPARTTRARQPVGDKAPAKTPAKTRPVSKATPAPKAVKLKSLDKPVAKAATGSKAGARPRKTKGSAEPVPT